MVALALLAFTGRLILQAEAQDREKLVEVQHGSTSWLRNLALGQGALTALGRIAQAQGNEAEDTPFGRRAGRG